jgi:glucosyl-3-phosphoglycerate synthase
VTDLVRTFGVEAATVESVTAAKAGRTVSLCIPCRNEVATIGSLVRTVRAELMTAVPLVDELIVLDDRSTDDTSVVAAAGGATVVPIDDVHRVHGVGHGKGNALWATLAASAGTFVVWCDADVTSFRAGWIARLLAPLVEHDDVALVKAFYERPSHRGGGGRTTELVARPLLSLYAPELTPLHQPLAGEFAARRDVMEAIPFVEGWGVEIAMLLDVAARCGVEAIGQVDLGVRVHRHRSLHELSVQAAEVAATLLGRVGGAEPVARSLARADGAVVPLNLVERPPLATCRRGGEPSESSSERTTWLGRPACP